MIHIEADLRTFVLRRPGPIYWILDPESAGTLIVHNPGRSHVFMTPMRGTPNEESSLSGRLEAALRVPTAARTLSVASWSPHVQVAERYRQGRVFRAGDAAHRFPPPGGLGLNTGILEVHDLVARLARVEAGRDGESARWTDTSRRADPPRKPTPKRASPTCFDSARSRA
jgi:2,4-dichlorophenol 6-monooxygenase